MSYFPASKTTRKPLQKYNPGVLGEDDIETLKMGVLDELWDISKSFIQTDEVLGDTYEKIDKVEIDIGHAKASIETVWYLSVTADEILGAMIRKLEGEFETESETLRAWVKEEAYIRLTADDALAALIQEIRAEIESEEGLIAGWIKITNVAWATADEVLALRIEEVAAMMETEDANNSASIVTETFARVTADEALAARITTLKADVETADNLLSSQIKDTNLVITDLEKTMALNKTELESSITGSSSSAKDALEEAQRKLEEAIAAGDEEAAEALRKEIERLQGVIDAGLTEVRSSIAITNKTVASLTETVATNKTELESKIDSVVDGSIGDFVDEAVAQARKELEKAQKELEAAIAAGDKEAIDRLNAEIERLTNIINANHRELTSKINVTNETVATLTQTVATNKTQLESSITTGNNNSQTALNNAKKALEQAVKDGDAAEAERLRKEIARLTGIIDANQSAITSKIDITNQTVATLTQTVASNKTQLESSINTSSNNATNAAVNQAQASLTTAKTALEKAIKEGDAAEAERLRLEIVKLNKVISDNDKSVNAKLDITNTTVANLDKSVATQITNLTSSFNGQIGSVNQTLNTHADKLGNLSASWGVTVDANGVIGGVQLVTDSKTKVSEFKVNADRMVFTNGAQSVKPITIVGNQAAFNNVLIREDCTILGTLYADNVIGLPAGKSFGLGESGPYSPGSDYVTVWSEIVEGSNGKFLTRGLLGGLPQVKFTGDASIDVRVTVNGQSVLMVQSAGTTTWTGMANFTGRAFDLGYNKTTMAIQVRCSPQSRGNAYFRMSEGFLYLAIDR